MLTKKCRHCKKYLELDYFDPDRMGRYGKSSTCKACKYQKGYNASKELKRTPIKPVSDKKKARLKETGGEKELFRQIIIERQENSCISCDICGKSVHLEEMKPWCFPHLLSKKDYPHLRMFKNNVGFTCNEICHQEVDKKVTGNKKELEKRILNGEKIDVKMICHKMYGII